MATINPYGKLDEAEQERLIARRKTRRRITIIAISSIVLAAVLVVATVVGVSQSKDHKSGGGTHSLSSSIKAACDLTLYPDSCYNSLAPLVKSGNLKPQDLYKLSVQVAIDELSKASKNFVENGVKKLNITDQKALAAIESCRELFSLALDHLNNSLSVSDMKLVDAFDDLRTWLSSAGTYQQTCMDEVGSASSTLSSFVNENLKNSTEYTSNSLAMISSFEESINALGAIKRRRLMSSGGEEPEWLSLKDRRLLQTPSSGIKADAVVAKDGSGRYKTIKAALKAVPDKSEKRFVIYVKKGVYFENVQVDKTKWNVMMVGDGKDATVVSGSLNVVDGTPTFQTATFAVFGQGFIARDMGFRNTAGAAKHQAVALMSTADLSVFYRCSMDAFQDTLYAHSNRQFYRECNIYGTVDFIFGNAGVVFQNCSILPRKPMLGQQNTITAQGKIDPNQNTGISIQNCTIGPAANLTGVSTFLGRPWKNYSTTVYIHNAMGNLIDPKGWLPWVGTTAPSTIFYVEFQNSGPGAVTKNRVKWKGLRLNLSAAQVKKFTVGPLINGDKWIPATGVSYKSGF